MMWILNAKDRENVKGMLQKREFCGVGMIIIINPVYSQNYGLQHPFFREYLTDYLILEYVQARFKMGRYVFAVQTKNANLIPASNFFSG